MGIEDKLNQAKGALKEGAGKLTGDKKTEIEGAVEKVVAKAKDGLEDVKKALKVLLKALKITLKNKTKKKFSSHLARELLFLFVF